MYDYLIVGAGFAGSVLAERLARDAGKKILLCDVRPHVAGNAFDHPDAAGVLVHKYGPHIFHTNSREIFDYLSQFTEWRPYEHRVRAIVDGKSLPIPINLDTINQLYGLNLDSASLEKFFESVREPKEQIRTSEDVVLNAVGRELYEKFFRGYTRKQWGLDPSELSSQVTARIPTRTNRDDRYFGDAFQFMPLHGFTHMFENMLDHENITLQLGTDYRELKDVPYRNMIYTGPIDEFFDFRFGPLPYRSLKFQHETHDREVFQDAPVVNYPDQNIPHTRITEFKYLTGQKHAKTSIVYEFPQAEGDPYYPIPRAQNTEINAKYQALVNDTPGLHFVGRLASYKYYNMDQVVGAALSLYARIADKPRQLRRNKPAAV